LSNTDRPASAGLKTTEGKEMNKAMEQMKAKIADEKACMAKDFPIGAKVITAHGEATIVEHVGSHVAIKTAGQIVSDKIPLAELVEYVKSGVARIVK
jgi:hypothetical protein